MTSIHAHDVSALSLCVTWGLCAEFFFFLIVGAYPLIITLSAQFIGPSQTLSHKYPCRGIRFDQSTSIFTSPNILFTDTSIRTSLLLTYTHSSHHCHTQFNSPNIALILKTLCASAACNYLSLFNWPYQTRLMPR